MVGKEIASFCFRELVPQQSPGEKDYSKIVSVRRKTAEYGLTMQNERVYGIQERRTSSVQTSHAEQSRYRALIRTDVSVSGKSLRRSLVHSLADSPACRMSAEMSAEAPMAASVHVL